jgi:hypothetical protein
MKKLIGLLLILIVSVAVAIGVSIYKRDTKYTGVDAVMYLYNFKDVYELSENDINLEEITTPEAYKYLTATNVTKALNTYLKFKNLPTSVIVLKSLDTTKGGYVLYTIQSDAISSGRYFTFIYEKKNGKIDNVQEYEGIKFKNDEPLYLNTEDEEGIIYGSDEPPATD